MANMFEDMDNEVLDLVLKSAPVVPVKGSPRPAAKNVEVDRPKKTKKKRIKILTPDKIIAKQWEYIPLVTDDPLWTSIGRLEKGARFYISGPSFSGKSSTMIRLLKPLVDVMMVDYNNHEEKGGNTGTVQVKLEQAGFTKERCPNFRFYKADIHCDEYETWDDILSKKNRPGFALIDSVDHSGLVKKDYISLSTKHGKKGMCFGVVKHWAPSDPYNRFLKHDADVKLEVINYVCYVESRLIDATNKPVVIWEQKAKELWGKRFKDVVSGKYWPTKKK